MGIHRTILMRSKIEKQSGHGIPKEGSGRTKKGRKEMEFVKEFEKKQSRYCKMTDFRAHSIRELWAMIIVCFSHIHRTTNIMFKYS